jgi:hypothetical protein
MSEPRPPDSPDPADQGGPGLVPDPWGPAVPMPKAWRAALAAGGPASRRNAEVAQPPAADRADAPAPVAVPPEALRPEWLELARRSERPHRWRVLPLAACAVIALVGLAGVVLSAVRVHAALTTVPAAVPRWQQWSAGEVFPEVLGASVTRLGISPDTGCATAAGQAAGRLAARDGCLAGLRASYADSLGGVVYTVGVFAFTDARAAASFWRALPSPSAGLQALTLPGTAAGRFSDQARQAGAARQAGSYVVLVADGYADGRPATGQPPPLMVTGAADLAQAAAVVLDHLQACARPAC